ELSEPIKRPLAQPLPLEEPPVLEWGLVEAEPVQQIPFIERRGAQASDERTIGQCRLQLGYIDRDDVWVQCKRVCSGQNHRQSVADRSPDPCERLAKALPRLRLRRVAPKERGD